MGGVEEGPKEGGTWGVEQGVRVGLLSRSPFCCCWGGAGGWDRRHLLLVDGVDTRDGGAVQGGRHVVHDGVQQRLHALVLEGRAGHAGGEGEGQSALADALLERRQVRLLGEEENTSKGGGKRTRGVRTDPRGCGGWGCSIRLQWGTAVWRGLTGSTKDRKESGGRGVRACVLTTPSR